MPVLVRNKERGPAVFSDPAKNIAVEWQGAGDPNGEDVQHVPDELTQNPNFLKALQRGVFEVVEASPEVQASLDQQVKAYQDRRTSAAEASAATLDKSTDQPIASVQIAEDGKVTSVASETGDVDPNTGKPIEAQVPVVMGPREYAPQQ